MKADQSMNLVVPERWTSQLELPKKRSECVILVELKSSEKKYQAQFSCSYY